MLPKRHGEFSKAFRHTMSGEIFDKAKKNKTDVVGPGKYLTTDKGSSENTAWLKQSTFP